MNIKPVSYQACNSVNQTNQTNQPKTQKSQNFKGTIVATAGRATKDFNPDLFIRYMLTRVPALIKGVTGLRCDFSERQVFTWIDRGFDDKGDQLIASLTKDFRDKGLGEDTIRFSFSSMTPEELKRPLRGV